MSTRFDVTLNKKLQIIEQRVEGRLDIGTYENVVNRTRQCAAELDNPSDVRILVDGRGIAKPDTATRKASVKVFGEPELKKMAIWGGDAFSRVVIKFFSLLAPGGTRLAGFKTREQAVEWLLKDR